MGCDKWRKWQVNDPHSLLRNWTDPVERSSWPQAGDDEDEETAGGVGAGCSAMGCTHMHSMHIVKDAPGWNGWETQWHCWHTCDNWSLWKSVARHAGRC